MLKRNSTVKAECCTIADTKISAMLRVGELSSTGSFFVSDWRLSSSSRFESYLQYVLNVQPQTITNVTL